MPSLPISEASAQARCERMAEDFIHENSSILQKAFEDMCRKGIGAVLVDHDGGKVSVTAIRIK